MSGSPRRVLSAVSVAMLLVLVAGCSRVPIQISRIAPPQYDIEPGGTVAVLPFSGTFGRDDAGEAMANSLTSQLVPAGYYKVIERARVKAIIDEQTFAKSDFVDPKTAGEIGRIVGAQYLIVGTVTGWSVEDDQSVEYVTEYRNTGYRDQNGAPIMQPYQVPVQVLVRRGTVAADFRMINAETASIIASASESESFRSEARGAGNMSQIPPREQILRNLSEIVSGRFFQKISAHRVTEGRILFKGKTPQCKQGVTFAQNGLWDMAVQQWNGALQARPGDFAPFHNLGVAAEIGGHYDEAERMYAQAIGLAPGNQDVQQHLQAVRRVRAEAARLRNPAPQGQPGQR